MALLWTKFEFLDPFWILFCQNSNFSPKKRTDEHIFISVYSHSQNNLISLSDRREFFQSFAVLLFRSISDFAMTMARSTTAVCERNVLTIDRSTFILYMLVVSLFFGSTTAWTVLSLRKFLDNFVSASSFRRVCPLLPLVSYAAALFFYVLWFHIHDMSMSSSV